MTPVQGSPVSTFRPLGPGGAAVAEKRNLKFGLIEVGRGVAAAVVVFHHAGNMMAEPRFFGVHPFGGHLRNFNVGVDFFFVLSGFIIAWVHWGDLGQPSKVSGYARKRFLRIFPPYWGILFPLIAFYLLVPGFGSPSQVDPVNIALSIVLLPYTAQPVLGVAWTLTHEIFFYLIFALVIAAGRRALWLLPAWAAIIVAGHAFQPLSYPLSFLLSPFNLEFILGVGTALLLRRRTIPMSWLLLALGIGAFASLMLFATAIQDDMLVGRLAFGVSAALFILGAVEIERSRPIPLHPALSFFGASSYSVYLVHTLALIVLLHIVSRIMGRALPPDLAALALAAGALAAGFAYHLLVESRLTRAAARLIGSPKEKKTLARQSP